MINDFFVLELDDINVNDLWLKKEGSTCHAVNKKGNILKTPFNELITSLRDLILDLSAGIYSS